MERQTTSGGPEQLHFDWSVKASVGPGKEGEAAGGAILSEVKQMSAAEQRTRALEQDLMTRVADEANLVEALQRVCANKGSARIDRMSVTELKAWFSQRIHREKLKEQLLSGSYEPALVRGVQIPKPGGQGMRQLGITLPGTFVGRESTTPCSKIFLPARLGWGNLCIWREDESRR